MFANDSNIYSALTAQQALRLLRFHWGSAYDIAYAWGMFIASRKDNGARVRCTDPWQLDQEMLTDYHAKPVPRDL